jgi:hypothetical protein
MSELLAKPTPPPAELSEEEATHFNRLLARDAGKKLRRKLTAEELAERRRARGREKAVRLREIRDTPEHVAARKLARQQHAARIREKQRSMREAQPTPKTPPTA